MTTPRTPRASRAGSACSSSTSPRGSEHSFPDPAIDPWSDYCQTAELEGTWLRMLTVEAGEGVVSKVLDCLIASGKHFVETMGFQTQINQKN